MQRLILICSLLVYMSSMRSSDIVFSTCDTRSGIVVNGIVSLNTHGHLPDSPPSSTNSSFSSGIRIWRLLGKTGILLALGSLVVISTGFIIGGITSGCCMRIAGVIVCSIYRAVASACVCLYRTGYRICTWCIDSLMMTSHNSAPVTADVIYQKESSLCSA